jgi:hypothetical protein
MISGGPDALLSRRAHPRMQVSFPGTAPGQTPHASTETERGDIARPDASGNADPGTAPGVFDAAMTQPCVAVGLNRPPARVPREHRGLASAAAPGAPPAQFHVRRNRRLPARPLKRRSAGRRRTCPRDLNACPALAAGAAPGPRLPSGRAAPAGAGLQPPRGPDHGIREPRCPARCLRAWTRACGWRRSRCAGTGAARGPRPARRRRRRGA